ncbi:hypothetical protein ACGYLO_12245 [Sulfitobacter sp. 1A13353]|uniref:hypothetical protein n=1 Tax=Sulfitobacter sp. 1A13353 TaxID=3368568 RepID=UPI0037466FC4
METLWFVLLTVIATVPTADGVDPSYVPGDVLQSGLVGGAETEAKCEKGAAILSKPIEQAAGGKAIVKWSCVEMAASVGVAQGFETIPRSRE